MEQAMHAARLVAVHSALLALLFEQQGDNLQAVDGVTVTLSHESDSEGLDVLYTSKGLPVAGEGL
ncbi:hypothetical protein CBP36_09505 [Acidovorax carolinensis]|uniref:Uncharacterized protein n=1 Tax=Acidovorax carolinensis TaxID=553814 RepID=A0A240UDC5_9BURK|nr:hypothetical protein [Acidovorax carolinensis]ART55176.1 hypothetical protein CBP35_09425 [Acidovorax carolinensis]ART59052.1 hypothetical protein CBP36_09505 [Acidovorax carolinensis]